MLRAAKQDEDFWVDDADCWRFYWRRMAMSDRRNFLIVPVFNYVLKSARFYGRWNINLLYSLIHLFLLSPVEFLQMTKTFMTRGDGWVAGLEVDWRKTQVETTTIPAIQNV